MNGLERLTTNSRSSGVSLLLKEVFLSRIFFSWQLEPLRKTIFVMNVSGWCYHVCSSSKLYMIPYTVLQTLRGNFCKPQGE